MAAGFQVMVLDANHTRLYQRRKPHRKSKNGCLACKVKRVKVRDQCCLTGELKRANYSVRRKKTVLCSLLTYQHNLLFRAA